MGKMFTSCHIAQSIRIGLPFISPHARAQGVADADRCPSASGS